MDFDLLSACIFCAASLFGSDLPPLPGFSGELAGSYATFQRVPDVRLDQSDVTMKAVMAGFDFAKPPRGDRGAGTPETEFRLRWVFPNAHTEALERDKVPNRIMSEGNGRYDNLSVLGRLAISPSLSLEGGWGQRRLVVNDLVDVGQSYFNFTEMRQLTSENIVTQLGVRYRGRRFELGAHVERVSIQGRVSTANVFMLARGNFFGANLDARWKQGRFAAGLMLRTAGGSTPIDASFAPGFEPLSASGQASMQSVRLDASYAFSRVEALVALSYGRARLPFVAIAHLGAETRAYDDGFLLDSTARDADLELAARVRLQDGLLVSAFLRIFTGTEDVTSVDYRLMRPGSTASVEHRYYFPFLIGVSAQFNFGAPAPRAPE